MSSGGFVRNSRCNVELKSTISRSAVILVKERKKKPSRCARIVTHAFSSGTELGYRAISA